MEKTYDGLNRLKKEITPLGDTTTWNYCVDTITCTLPSGEQIIERYEAGSLVECELSYDYAMNGLLTKKTSQFSTVNIRYNTSCLPYTMHRQLKDDSYEETFRWTSGGKLLT